MEAINNYNEQFGYKNPKKLLSNDELILLQKILRN